MSYRDFGASHVGRLRSGISFCSGGPDDESKAQQAGGDEPPPRFSVRGRAAIRACLVRSTVPVGGGRSPLSFDNTLHLTMKMIVQMMLLTLLVGCASTPSPEVRQAAQRYQAVSRWMSRDEVYRILGQPQSRLSDGREQWRVSGNRHSAELLLRFGADGNITEMEQHYPMATE